MTGGSPKKRKGPTPKRVAPPQATKPRHPGRRRAVLVVVVVGIVVAIALVGVVDTARLWQGVDRVDVTLPGAAASVGAVVFFRFAVSASAQSAHRHRRS